MSNFPPARCIDSRSEGEGAGLLRAVSLVSQQIPSSQDGAVVQFELTKESEGISVSGGEIEFSKAGIYSLFIKLHLSVVSGFTQSVETWFQYSADGGALWQNVPDSGDIKEFDSFNEGSVIYKANFTATEMTMLRVRIRTTGGTPELESPTLTNGVKVPSTSISIGSL